MALTAAIRSVLIGLLAALVGTAAAWLSATLGVEIGPEDQLKLVLFVVTFVMTFGSGVVAYVVNKLGNKYPIVNQIMSLGRAKTGAMFVPNNKESVTATATESGNNTHITVESAAGNVNMVKV